MSTVNASWDREGATVCGKAEDVRGLADLLRLPLETAATCLSWSHGSEAMPLDEALRRVGLRPFWLDLTEDCSAPVRRGDGYR